MFPDSTNRCLRTLASCAFSCPKKVAAKLRAAELCQQASHDRYTPFLNRLCLGEFRGMAWNKVLVPMMAPSVGFPPVIVAGLDHRFDYSPTFPLPVIVLGLRLIPHGSAFVVRAMIPAMLALIVTVIRTTLEDWTLQEKLTGYRECMRRVRYRLIPGVH